VNVFSQCLVQDCRAILRSRKAWFDPIIFFSLMIALFGVAIGFDPKPLQQFSPAIVWISFFLTSLMSIETLFRRDYAEGVLEQLVLSPQPLWELMLAKSLAFWLAFCIPLLL
jgi:heme exporter protein B